ncbi:hypothetical protein O9992_28505 [Vibrio lentus]|nr:hypothetical protein [Vibrio lentus]
MHIARTPEPPEYIGTTEAICRTFILLVITTSSVPPQVKATQQRVNIHLWFWLEHAHTAQQHLTQVFKRIPVLYVPYRTIHYRLHPFSWCPLVFTGIRSVLA